MAISKGNKAFDGEVKRYIGLGVVKVIAVNPSKSQLEDIFSRAQDKEPSYVGEREINGEKFQTATVKFVIATIPEKNNGIETINSFNFTLTNRRKADSTGKKFQVIDEYGRTAWVTEEQFTAKSTVLTKKDGSTYQASISENYRYAYDGEDRLTDFIKVWLNIPNVMKFVDNKPSGYIDKPQDAECRLDSVAEYFKGDFSEIVDLSTYQPENKFKIAFGVTTNAENNQFQAFFTDMVLSPAARKTERLEKAIQERQENNGYQNTEFSVEPLHEYSLTPSQPAAAPANPVAPKGWFPKK